VTIADYQVIVVGGAIGGASTALLLAQAGARVTLLERTAEPKAVGAGIALAPNGLAVLYALGLKEELQVHGTRLTEGRVEDASTKPLVHSPVPNYGEGLDHVLIIHRADLYRVLLDAVESHASIDARYGAAVTAATRDGSVTVEKDGQRETLQADLVVGADGVHSVVRSGGNFGARVQGLGTSYVRGLSSARINASSTAETWTALGLFGRAPLAEGTYFFSSTRAPVLAQAIARHDLEAYRAAWAKSLPLTRAILAPLQRFDELLINEVEEVHCDRFFDGRLVLVGDAAHAMAPNLGQGANSALVDAAALASSLARSADLPSALAAYDQRRRPRVQQVQGTARQMSSAADLQNALQRTVRDTAVRALANAPGGTERTMRLAMQEDPAELYRAVRGLVVSPS
jgi:2-polyprenyl-6-methoxyphenol hydroxylase-like FAD-dependent oxidoreductase